MWMQSTRVNNQQAQTHFEDRTCESEKAQHCLLFVESVHPEMSELQSVAPKAQELQEMPSTSFEDSAHLAQDHEFFETGTSGSRSQKAHRLPRPRVFYHHKSQTSAPLEGNVKDFVEHFDGMVDWKYVYNTTELPRSPVDDFEGDDVVWKQKAGDTFYDESFENYSSKEHHTGRNKRSDGRRGAAVTRDARRLRSAKPVKASELLAEELIVHRCKPSLREAQGSTPTTEQPQHDMQGEHYAGMHCSENAGPSSRRKFRAEISIANVQQKGILSSQAETKQLHMEAREESPENTSRPKTAAPSLTLHSTQTVQTDKSPSKAASGNQRTGQSRAGANIFRGAISTVEDPALPLFPVQTQNVHRMNGQGPLIFPGPAATQKTMRHASLRNIFPPSDDPERTPDESSLAFQNISTHDDCLPQTLDSSSAKIYCTRATTSQESQEQQKFRGAIPKALDARTAEVSLESTAVPNPSRDTLRETKSPSSQVLSKRHVSHVTPPHLIKPTSINEKYWLTSKDDSEEEHTFSSSEDDHPQKADNKEEPVPQSKEQDFGAPDESFRFHLETRRVADLHTSPKQSPCGPPAVSPARIPKFSIFSPKSKSPRTKQTTLNTSDEHLLEPKILTVFPESYPRQTHEEPCEKTNQSEELRNEETELFTTEMSPLDLHLARVVSSSPITPKANSPKLNAISSNVGTVRGIPPGKSGTRPDESLALYDIVDDYHDDQRQVTLRTKPFLASRFRIRRRMRRAKAVPDNEEDVVPSHLL